MSENNKMTNEEALLKASEIRNRIREKRENAENLFGGLENKEVSVNKREEAPIKTEAKGQDKFAAILQVTKLNLKDITNAKETTSTIAFNPAAITNELQLHN